MKLHGFKKYYHGQDNEIAYFKPRDEDSYWIIKNWESKNIKSIFKNPFIYIFMSSPEASGFKETLSLCEKFKKILEILRM